jgi:hypothetical protein
VEGERWGWNLNRIVIRYEHGDLRERSDTRIRRFGVGKQHQNRFPRNIEVATATWDCQQVVVSQDASAIDRWHDLLRRPCDLWTMVVAVI